jgi:glycosyltransferase involved in cell wall biosynthesis
MHGHWVVPGGLMAATAAGRLPLVVSLHGSDVFVAERNRLARLAAKRVLRRADWITACSEDLRLRAVAIGAPAGRTETVPYGVDLDRFAPDPAIRAEVRAALGLGDAPVVFTAGRLVSKKGFEFLIDAATALRADVPALRVLIAGDGDLREALRARAESAGAPVTFLGLETQDAIGRLAAAADIVAVPSVRDEAGNVDGLPNFALESLATATPVVATNVGGLPQAIDDGVNGRIVPERDAAALAGAIADLLRRPDEARALGHAARARLGRDFSWPAAAARFAAAYDRAGK